MKLYVEGGGDTSALKTACREGFTSFITNAGVLRRPRVVACGSRRDAFESFCTSIANGEAAMLLVDSEAPVAAHHEAGEPEQWQPWKHLKARQGDGWDQPVGASDIDCHLMTQVMESWFIADRQMLTTFFGQHFKENALPAPGNPVEQLAKAAVFESLKLATRDCKPKGRYGKADHSFKILALLDPAHVTSASPWAKRFVDVLAEKMDA